MFKDIFGDSPQTKILDFLADHPDFDYSISEIAKNAKVSRPTVYKIKDVLLKKGLIVKTREHGGSPLYKLNIEDKIVQIILKFDFEIAKKLADIESEEAVKKDTAALVKVKNNSSSKKTAAIS